MDNKKIKTTPPSRPFHCPLTNDENIAMGECYDIQMIRIKFVRKDLLGYEVDLVKAEELCDTCPSRQSNLWFFLKKSKKQESLCRSKRLSRITFDKAIL